MDAMSDKEWVAAALVAGVEPQYVWQRSALEDKILDKCAELQNALQRQSIAMCGLLARDGDEDELTALMVDGPNALDVVREWHQLNIDALRMVADEPPRTEASN